MRGRIEMMNVNRRHDYNHLIISRIGIKNSERSTAINYGALDYRPSAAK